MRINSLICCYVLAVFSTSTKSKTSHLEDVKNISNGEKGHNGRLRRTSACLDLHHLCETDPLESNSENNYENPEKKTEKASRDKEQLVQEDQKERHFFIEDSCDSISNNETFCLANQVGLWYIYAENCCKLTLLQKVTYKHFDFLRELKMQNKKAMQIGLIGLGNMGRNLALNLDDKGYKLHVYNRTASKTESLAQERPSIVPHYTIEDLVEGINEEPKIILMMLTTGMAIDTELKVLSDYLTPLDIVIDAGNSYFKDTIRRTSEYKFKYVGAGVSGGKLGARYGASIMVGCELDTWRVVGSILSDLSITSKYTHKKCCDWFGENGAGHFVKMVHNGIEYCDMANISETYKIFKHMKYDNEKISDIFQQWNNEELDSYLLEISYKILMKKLNNEFAVDQIEDSAQQKGTGKDCVIESVILSSPAVSIMEATFSRVINSRRDIRKKLSQSLTKSTSNVTVSDCDLRNALYLCRAISYVQGFNLLKEAFAKYNWDSTLTRVCEVWTDGCILRGSFLNVMKEICEEQIEDFEASQTFIKICNDNIQYLQKVVMYCAGHGISIPTISSCLNYILGMTTEDSPGNLIQAMRDCFGAHTVTLKDSGEVVHIDWLE